MLAAINCLRDELKSHVRRLRKLFDCWHTNNRTQIESSEFKRSLVAHYQRGVAIDIELKFASAMREVITQLLVSVKTTVITHPSGSGAY